MYKEPYEVYVDTYKPSTTIPSTYWEYPYKITDTGSAYNWITTYPTTIYMYQIMCPDCETTNWAELEKTIVCKNKKCKAKLRAVTSKPDHVVEVGE